MLIDTEEFKHKINNSDLYGTEAWDKVMNILAECESKNGTIETTEMESRYNNEEVNNIYKNIKHEYIISSERAYRCNNEQNCRLYSDKVYKIGDVIFRQGIGWFIEEVIK